MVGPADLDELVVRAQAAGPLCVLLQAALRALQGHDRCVALDLRPSDLEEPVTDGFEAEVEVDGTREGLERRSQERGTEPCSPPRLASPQQQRLPDTDSRRESREARRRDDRRTPSRERSLVVEGVTPEERLRDHQVDDRVTEIFEALVMGAGLVGVLVQVAAVDEGLLDEIEVAYRETEPLGKDCRRTYEVRSRRTRGRQRRGPARTNARRCSRRRPGRSGSSRRPRRRSRFRTPPRGS